VGDDAEIANAGLAHRRIVVCCSAATMKRGIQYPVYFAPMANKRSAMKAHRVGERRYARNRPVRSALRTFVKKARTGIADAARGAVEEATALVAAAAKELDQAASKGIIHKNQAARRKSRLMHQLASAAKLAAEAPEAAAAPRPGRRRAAATTTAEKSAAKKPAAKKPAAKKPAAKKPAASTRSRAAAKPAEPAAEKPTPTRARTRRAPESS
jgi:small subunit ribosomal protein S20